MGNFNSQNWKITLVSENSKVYEVIENLEISGAQVCLLIGENGILVGTVTDGDVRRGFISGVSLESPAKSIANKNPVTVTESNYKKDILSLMESTGVRQIPILNLNNQVCGLHIFQEMKKAPSRKNLLIIMAGGRGKRLQPFTDSIPKPLLKVAGKPIIMHIIESAKNHGILNFIISINHLGYMIKDLLGTGSHLGINITYLEEENSLGTAGSLSLLSEKPNVPFIVSNADLITQVNYSDLLENHITNQSAATMAVKTHNLNIPYGVVTTRGKTIQTYTEKPNYKCLINAGVYVLSPESLEFLNYGEYAEMPELFLKLIEAGRNVNSFFLLDSWMDIGTESDLNLANEKFV